MKQHINTTKRRQATFIMKVFTLDILNKKTQSGAEVGQAYLYDLVAPVIGKERIPESKLIQMSAALQGEEIGVFRRYMGVYNWLMQENALAQATLFHARTTALEMLRILERAAKEENERSTAIRTPVILNWVDFVEYTQRQVEDIIAISEDGIISPNERGNGTFLTVEDMVDFAILRAAHSMPDRDTFLDIRSFIYRDYPSIPIEPTSKAAKEALEDNLRWIKPLEEWLTEYLPPVMKDQIPLGADEVEQLRRSLADRLKRKAKATAIPARLAAMDEYEEIQRTAQGIAYENGVKGFANRYTPASSLYYADFCGGFFSFCRDVAGSLGDFPRIKQGGVIYQFGEENDIEPNFIIDESGKPFDLIVNPVTLKEYDSSGIMRLSEKVEGGKYRQELLGMYESILQDLTQIKQYDTLVFVLNELVGVPLNCLFIGSWGIPAFDDYNHLLADLNERTHKPADKEKAHKSKGAAYGKKNAYFIYRNEKERKQRLEVLEGLPLLKSSIPNYPDEVYNRIAAKMEDLSVFGGSSRELYGLFDY